MPDRGGARAVLIGTGRHTADSGLPDVPSIAGTLSDLAEALRRHCGLPADAIKVVADPVTVAEIGDAVATAAARAGDLLLVYYVGHGLVSARGGLHLATQGTSADPDRLEYTGLPYAVIARQVRACAATNRVVVLDCCFAGRVLDGAAGLGEPDGDELADRAVVPGGFVLTATSRLVPAIAPEGARHTAFTGAFLRLLRDGDRQGPARITLRHVHQYLSRVLPEQGLPRPRCRSDNAAGELELAVNPAYQGEQAVLGAAGTEPAPASPLCPYKGLAPFDVGDEQWFHGRERLTAELVRRLDDAPRPLVVVGASGAGKSSLLRAGLLPAIGRGGLSGPDPVRRPCLILTPGRTPVPALAELLAARTGRDADEVASAIHADPTVLPALMRGAGPGDRPVLVVDQFEELFTLCDSEGQRTGFVRALIALASADLGGPACAFVVIAVREEFYGRLTGWPELARGAPVVVAAMSAAEVRDAIESPARKAALILGPGLTELLLEDLGSGSATAAYEAGRLPLLSHALRATWQRHDGTMTVQGYRSTGGIQEALARTAESVLDQVPPEDRGTARRLLLRLVRVGDNTDHVRRVLPRSELVDGLPAGAAHRIIEVFTGDEARLLSADGAGVRLTHEALIRSWPRLREWLATDRVELLAQQELITDAAEWHRRGRTADYLYRGERLAAVRGSDRHPSGSVTADFLRAGAVAARLRARARAGAATTLVLLLIVALVTAGVALRLRGQAGRQAQEARDQAMMYRAETIRAEDSLTAMSLGTAAYRNRPGPDTRASLVTTLLRSRYRATPVPSGPVRTSLGFSDDGRLLAAAGGDVVTLWDLTSPEQPIEIGHLPAPRATLVAFAPDSRLLAVGSDQPGRTGSAVELWRLTDPAHPVRLGAIGPLRRGATGPYGVTALAFNGDGTVLATARAGFGASTTLWSVADPARPVRRVEITGHSATVYAVDFSPDGTVLATGSKNNVVVLWRVGRSGTPVPLSSAAPTNSDIMALRFSRDGRQLVAGTVTSTVLFDVRDPVRPRRLPALPGSHTGSVRAIGLSPDSGTMILAGVDRIVTVWAVGDLAHPVRLADLADQHAGVEALGFSADGRHFVTAGDDGSMLLWATADAAHPNGLTCAPPGGSPVREPTAGRPRALATSADGRLLLDRGLDAEVLLRGPDASAEPVTLPIHSGGKSPISAAAFSRDNSLLAVDENGTTHLLDVTDPRAPTERATVTRDGTKAAGLAFGGDDRTLVATSLDGSRSCWDVADLHESVADPAGRVRRLTGSG
ncbi:caspase, EACC1-associated type [Micromonosporaceae bacterium Da 78-11]